MSTIRDAYVVGKTGSHFVPTVEKTDAKIRQLTAKLDGADPVAREWLWHDIDKLLERRQVMTTAVMATP